MNKKIKIIESEKEIRTFLRKKRSELDPEKQSQASQRIDELISGQQAFLESKSI